MEAADWSVGGGEGGRQLTLFNYWQELLGDFLIFEKSVSKIDKALLKKICGHPLANFWEDIDISLQRTHSSADSLAGRQL